MTKEEAIKHLHTYSSINGSGLTTQDQHEEAKKMAIKALETQLRWIPVTERLPEEEGLYLVVGDFPPGAEVHTRYFNVLHDRSVWSGTMTDKVKWWMPIPKQPEGAQDEN